MKSTISQLSELKLIGLAVRTNNKNEMNQQTSKIGGLAGRFWSQNIANQIPNRKNKGITFSVYTEYDSDEHGDYTFFIGEEVTEIADIPGFQQLTIKSATYKKFTTPPGKMPEVVITAWQQIWKMSAADFDGERAYVADFEVYDERASDLAHAVVDIYIGIK